MIVSSDTFLFRSARTDWPDLGGVSAPFPSFVLDKTLLQPPRNKHIGGSAPVCTHATDYYGYTLYCA